MHRIVQGVEGQLVPGVFAVAHPAPELLRQLAQGRAGQIDQDVLRILQTVGVGIIVVGAVDDLLGARLLFIFDVVNAHRIGVVVHPHRLSELPGEITAHLDSVDAVLAASHVAVAVRAGEAPAPVNVQDGAPPSRAAGKVELQILELGKEGVCSGLGGVRISGRLLHRISPEARKAGLAVQTVEGQLLLRGVIRPHHPAEESLRQLRRGCAGQVNQQLLRVLQAPGLCEIVMDAVGIFVRARLPLVLDVFNAHGVGVVVHPHGLGKLAGKFAAFTHSLGSAFALLPF